MRFTFPAVITSAIKLCRRYKNREHLEDDWGSKVEAILKFVRQLTSILATQVDAPTIALRLFLLAAQIADECGFEDLAYDLYVEAFTVYEEGISESRAQLQAITLVIGTLQGARVFGVDNYDTLITKAALYGAKLLKKPHQASAVHLASHMWWQESSTLERAESATPAGPEKPATVPQTKDGEDGVDAPKAVRRLAFETMQRAHTFIVSAPRQQTCPRVSAKITPYCQLCNRRYCYCPALRRHPRSVSILLRPWCDGGSFFVLELFSASTNALALR